MRLDLGKIVQTHAARYAIPDRADWGECCAEDAAENDAALERGRRIIGVHRFGRVKFLVVTNRDRSVTTVMLPEDF